MSDAPPVENQTELGAVGWEDVNLPRYFAWSGLCSLTVDGLLHPLELLKIRFQVQGNTFAKPTYPHYPNFRTAVKTMFRQEGVRGFWKGFSSAGFSGLLSQYSYYASYEVSKTKLHRLAARLSGSKDNEALTHLVHILSGGTAEFISQVTETPLNIVARRLMIQGPKEYAHNHLYTGPIHAIRTICASEGVRGFYRGFGAALLTGMPASATLFTSYEWVRRHLHDFRRSRGMYDSIDSHFVHIVSGAVAGVMAAVVVQPLDLAQSRLQVQLHTPGGMAPKYRNAFHAIRTVAREEGVWALSKGLFPRVLHFVPVGALGFSTYEMVKFLSKER